MCLLITTKIFCLELYMLKKISEGIEQSNHESVTYICTRTHISPTTVDAYTCLPLWTNTCICLSGHTHVCRFCGDTHIYHYMDTQTFLPLQWTHTRIYTVDTHTHVSTITVDTHTCLPLQWGHTWINHYRGHTHMSAVTVDTHTYLT